jgi:cytochrome c nitrite reductase small subunit
MNWSVRAVVVLGALVAAVVFGGIAIPLTNHPQFCASCHNIRPSYDTWIQSSHKDVTCVDCHVRPGIKGWLHDKAWAGTKDVMIMLFGHPTDAANLVSTVSSDVCLSCHRHILRTSEVAPRDLPPPVKEVGLVMSHRKHMEAFAKRGKEEGCTTCHSRVVHENTIKGYPVVIPRGHVSADDKPWLPSHPEGTVLRKKALDDCFRCHDGKTQHEGRVLSRKCDACHIPEKISGSLLFD